MKRSIVTVPRLQLHREAYQARTAIMRVGGAAERASRRFVVFTGSGAGGFIGPRADRVQNVVARSRRTLISTTAPTPKRKKTLPTAAKVAAGGAAAGAGALLLFALL